jgi:hypothetical protein
MSFRNGLPGPYPPFPLPTPLLSPHILLPPGILLCYRLQGSSRSARRTRCATRAARALRNIPAVRCLRTSATTSTLSVRVPRVLVTPLVRGVGVSVGAGAGPDSIANSTLHRQLGKTAQSYYWACACTRKSLRLLRQRRGDWQTGRALRVDK